MSLKKEIQKALNTVIENGKKNFNSSFKDDQCIIKIKFMIGKDEYNVREKVLIVNKDIADYSNKTALWVSQKTEDLNYDLHQGVVIHIELSLHEKRLTDATACFRDEKMKDPFALASVSPSAGFFRNINPFRHEVKTPILKRQPAFYGTLPPELKTMNHEESNADDKLLHVTF